jgi:hypothetical protein
MATTDPLASAVETFSAPIETLIIALGQGISQAQQDMDRNSIKTQQMIDTDPVLSQYGLQATWYQFPSVNMQLKMSLSITQDQAPASATNVTSTLLIPPRFRLIAQPLSASFQNQFNYDAQAATQVNVTIVPVPPPKSGDQVSTPPQMTPDSVKAVALKSGAPFVTTTNAQGQIVDAAGNVYTMAINFNGAARVWYVLQYAPSNAAIATVVVAVDDATQTASIISTT